MKKIIAVLGIALSVSFTGLPSDFITLKDADSAVTAQVDIVTEFGTTLVKFPEARASKYEQWDSLYISSQELVDTLSHVPTPKDKNSPEFMRLAELEDLANQCLEALVLYKKYYPAV